MTNTTERPIPAAWMSKHPCAGCGTGYGFCAQYALSSLKCCEACEHPTRWGQDPWTADEVSEMWEGKEMPPMVKETLSRLVAKELRDGR